MNTILQTKKLCKTFSTGGIQQHVLKNLNIEIYQGDFTVIMGSSGSGKSTLLYAVSGMDKPTLGDIYFQGENIATYSNDQLSVFRRNNGGFVFQQIHLLDNMNVMDNVLAAGLLISSDRKTVSGYAAELFDRVGLSGELRKKFPSQLSGGEAQRVGIVRALINKPKIVFADEPTGALNSTSGANVLDVMTEINQGGQSIVAVTHDMKTAARGSRILYLRDGSICGDLHLDQYDGSEGLQRGRMEQIQEFLAGMGW